MAKIKLENHTGQILKGMMVSCPEGGYYWKGETPIKASSRIVFECMGNNRLGIGRYKINLKHNSELYHSFNYAMDDNDKPYHAIWRLESKPLSAKDIYELYGYKVGDNGERLVSYKITGSKRAMKLMKYYKEICDFEKYREIELEWEDCKSKNKVFKNPLYFQIFSKKT